MSEIYNSQVDNFNIIKLVFDIHTVNPTYGRDVSCQFFVPLKKCNQAMSTSASNNTIVIVKESRKGEKRVALTPKDVKTITLTGNEVIVESGAGESVHFSDQDYLNAGAKIRLVSEDYKSLFENAQIILRVKRAERSREIKELESIPSGATIIGFLDPLDETTPHMAEWENKNVKLISLDQLDLSPEDPSNTLTAMSSMTGKIALEEAIKLHSSIPKNILVLGTGSVGQSAIKEAAKKSLKVTAIGSKPSYKNNIEKMGASYFPFQKSEKFQKLLQELLSQTDIVIASARKRGEKAPILVDKPALSIIKKGSVLVDLARTEGGNITGSRNDQTIYLENDVIITNSTGYPKFYPIEATQAFSKGLSHFIKNHLFNGGG